MKNEKKFPFDHFETVNKSHKRFTETTKRFKHSV